MVFERTDLRIVDVWYLPYQGDIQEHDAELDTLGILDRIIRVLFEHCQLLLTCASIVCNLSSSSTADGVLAIVRSADSLSVSFTNTSTKHHGSNYQMANFQLTPSPSRIHPDARGHYLPNCYLLT